MSENENLPPAPSKQTSSVPLKKETVRVTLKAADAPPAVPSATVPMAPPVRPPIPGGPPTATVPGALRPKAPAPTIPLRTAGPPTLAPAPTIRLATTAAPTSPGLPGAPPRTAGGAPTLRLTPSAAPTPPGLPGAPPRTAGGAPTIALPKATVQLQPPTQPLGTSFSSPSQLGTLKIAEDDDEEEGGSDRLSNILSIVGFAAALVVLSLQLKTASVWISAEDNAKKGEWAQLME